MPMPNRVRAIVIVLLVGTLLGARADAPSPRQVAPTRTATHGFALMPVPGPVLQRFRPPLTRFGAGHRGVDLAAAEGEPVVAAMGGTVTFSGRVARVGWVTVDHGATLQTTYGPLAPRLVHAGEAVMAGEMLGFVARDAGHLDWGARIAREYIDPLSLLGRWETFLTARESATVPALGGMAAGSNTASAAPRAMLRPVGGAITSSYGTRRHPVTGDVRLHAGIDFGAAAGTPIRAAAGGVVTFAGVATGYGNTVIVDHGGATTTLYAHQSALAVRTGQAVAAGQTLGSVGATGLATGPHLHFEVRTAGGPQDPVGWLRD